jgi:3-hydroxyacyl-[acyl-carrier-protein] dehydratase
MNDDNAPPPRGPVLGPEQIRAWLPHREPFLMVDALLELEVGKRAVGVKYVRSDEDWVRGHFPGFPILPGVLIAEALAQVAALLYRAEHPEQSGALPYLVGLDKMRFRRPVRPGDELRLEVSMLGHKRRIWQFAGAATVDGERAADGQFLATVEERP